VQGPFWTDDHLEFEVLDGVAHGDRQGAALHQELDAQVQLAGQVARKLPALGGLIVLWQAAGLVKASGVLGM